MLRRARFSFALTKNQFKNPKTQPTKSKLNFVLRRLRQGFKFKQDRYPLILASDTKVHRYEILKSTTPLGLRGSTLVTTTF